MLSELRRLSDTGLSEEQVLQGIKCWLIHCLDERQSFGLKVSYSRVKGHGGKIM